VLLLPQAGQQAGVPGVGLGAGLLAKGKALALAGGDERERALGRFEHPAHASRVAAGVFEHHVGRRGQGFDPGFEGRHLVAHLLVMPLVGHFAPGYVQGVFADVDTVVKGRGHGIENKKGEGCFS
jgi:hypothetical protein